MLNVVVNVHVTLDCEIYVLKNTLSVEDVIIVRFAVIKFRNIVSIKWITNLNTSDSFISKVSI
jgi:hypothetical protein